MKGFNLKELGAELGIATDHTQADLLNAFARSLKVNCKEGLDNQMCYVSAKLTKDAQQVFIALADFIKLEQENPSSLGEDYKF